MPKLREIRQSKNLSAKQVADNTGIDATMLSRFENYRALPIPTDFIKIVDALGCEPTDIYDPDEVRLLPDTTKTTVSGARASVTPAEYKLTVRLSNKYRDVLTREVLKTCGYKSLADWINACVLRLQNDYQKKKSPASRQRATNAEPQGRKPTKPLQQNNTTSSPETQGD